MRQAQCWASYMGGSREDPHQFGARIPNAPRSVEFMQLAGAGEASRFGSFAGKI